MAYIIEEIKSRNYAEIKEISERRKTAEENVRKKEITEEKIPVLEEKIKSGTEYINSSVNNISAKKAEKNAFEKQYAEIKTNLKYESKKDAENYILSLKTKKKAIEDNIEKTKGDFDLLKEEIIKNNAEAETLKAQLENIEEENIDELYAKRNNFSDKKLSFTEERDNIKSKISENNKTVKTLEPKINKFSEVEKRLTVIKPLSDTANGTVSGKERVTLETYVQTAYFDIILNRANTRFMIMTDGQYEMKRQRAISIY